jgi:ADP-ribosylglycohydrolase
VEMYGASGPSAPEGSPAEVTDDTQMALAVGEALAAAKAPYTVSTLEPQLRKAFVAWMLSPENNRAPGMTCMSACRRLLEGKPWVEATVLNSKGCGANMRVAPVGLLPNTDAATRAGIAQFQAALTHGHPTGLAASDLTAAAVDDLAHGGDPILLPARLREYARSQRQQYHSEWLGPLWHEAGFQSALRFMEYGWDECLSALDRLDHAVANPDRRADPCLATGGGWIAEEAFTTGLLCFLLYPEDPVAALRRATVTSGDSDSIACLTGAFAGACHGMAAWPADWVSRIEYRDRLQVLGDAWD